MEARCRENADWSQHERAAEFELLSTIVTPSAPGQFTSSTTSSSRHLRTSKYFSVILYMSPITLLNFCTDPPNEAVQSAPSVFVHP